MNQDYRDLEKQLEALQPKQPSSRVRDGIATRLATSPRRNVGKNVWALGVAALAIAAGLTAALLLRPSDIPVVPPRPDTQLVHDQEVANTPPTWLAYRRVLAESDESLDRLLDAHGACLLAQSSPTHGLGSLYQELLPN